MTAPAHAAIYDKPALYELAFSFRNLVKEGDFLLAAFERRRNRHATSFLELAAGPAGHAIELGSRGLTVAGLDLSQAMADYALGRARERGVALDYAVGDMISFHTEQKFDLIATMLSSATYILHDEDIVRHLESVADALTPDGMYFIELPHPSSLDGRSTVSESWKVADENGELEVTWASEDTTKATTMCTATFDYRPKSGPPVVLREKAPERLFRRDEFAELVRRSGRFELEATLGALDERVTMDAPEAWRMVVMLRRAP